MLHFGCYFSRNQFEEIPVTLFLFRYTFLEQAWWLEFSRCAPTPGCRSGHAPPPCRSCPSAGCRCPGTASARGRCWPSRPSRRSGPARPVRPGRRGGHRLDLLEAANGGEVFVELLDLAALAEAGGLGDLEVAGMFGAPTGAPSMLTRGASCGTAAPAPPVPCAPTAPDSPSALVSAG
ncbi:hypothetical protein D9M69_489680 [compost metagenome]